MTDLSAWRGLAGKSVKVKMKKFGEWSAWRVKLLDWDKELVTLQEEWNELGPLKEVVIKMGRLEVMEIKVPE